MAGMYEKLGDLLNETLEAGHVKFIHIEREEAEQDEAFSGAGQETVSGGADASGAGRDAGGQAGGGQSGGKDAGSQSAEGQSGGNDAGSRTGGHKGDGDFARTFYRAETEAERRYFKTSRNDGKHRTSGDSGSSGGSYRRVIYRRITPELEKAFALLGLENTTDKDAVKKAYKEKLLYYHPDRYAGKDVMEKVANDKTREVVAAYRLIMETIA